MATTTDYSADRTIRGRLTQINYPDDSGEQRQVAPQQADVSFDGQELSFVDKWSRNGSLNDKEHDGERISEQSVNDGKALRHEAEKRGAKWPFFLELPDNPCLIPNPTRWSASEAETEAFSSTDSFVGTDPLIGLKQLNAISQQLNLCASRDEIFATLQSSLGRAFPTAEISVSKSEPSHDQPATAGSFVLPLNAKGQSLGSCRVSQQRSSFRPEEIEFLHAVGQHARAALELIEMTEERQRSFGSMIKAMALTLDARDELTAGHSARVANYSTATARYLGLTAKEQRLTYYAGLLHDYGKIGVRDDVLCKPGKLTPEEYEHIKQHPVYSFHILSRINFGEDLAAIPLIAGSHHERPDGLGYPRGLKGEDIHICSRIIGVTDFFDALTAVRHYRQPLHPDEVITMIEAGRDTQFDGVTIDAFRSYYEEEYRPRYERRQQQVRQAAHAK